MRKSNGKGSGETLTDAELKAISGHAVTRAFPKNAIVVNEGDRTDSLYIIVSGRVKVYVSDDAGKEIVLSNAGPGEYFGEMVLDEGPRSASVMTLEPTKFSIVQKDDFRAFLKANPEFAQHLIVKLIHRVRLLTENVKSLALMDVYGRVARMLLEMADDQGGALVIENRPTQQEMASRIGASREMVSKIITDLAAGGYVRVEGRRMVIAKSLPSRW